jgi:hypothetical protein
MGLSSRLAARGCCDPRQAVVSGSLHNAEFAHVTRDDAAETRCFRYLRKFFQFVITIFKGVITHPTSTRPQLDCEARLAQFRHHITQ